MRKMMILCLIGLIFQVTNSYTQKKSLTAIKITQAPLMDGRLDDQCWGLGVWGGDFIQREPVSEQPATEKTEFKILYDENHIYVGIRAYDSEPNKIDKRIARRDTWVGDIVGVAFDTYYDQRNAFEFDITAGGVKIDAIAQDNATNWNMDWDPIWDGEVFYEDSAWTAEIKIPFSQIRFPSAADQIWGLHVVRYIHRKQEESDWTNIPQWVNGMAHLYGELKGLRGLKRKKYFEILPFFVFEHESLKADKNNPFTDGKKNSFRGGLDGKAAVHSDYTLDFTIYPDFGQVEADPASINLTSFETFFEEKRPFFIEGKNIFDFSIDNDILFYSRRIGNKPSFIPEHDYIDYPERTTILTAEKISGKNDKGFSLGMIHGLTKKEEAEIFYQGKKEIKTVEPLTNYFVFRGKQELNRGNTVFGGMITSVLRDVDDIELKSYDKNSYTGGIDFLQQWDDKNYYFQGKFVSSRIQGDELSIKSLYFSPVHNFQRPDALHLKPDFTKNSMSGWGGVWEIGKGGGFWRYSENFSLRSPGLELNDIGYLRQADIMENTFRFGINQSIQTGLFNRFSAYLIDSREFDCSGENQGNSFKVEFHSTLKTHQYLNANFTRSYNRFDTRLLRGGPRMRLSSLSEIFIYLSSDQRKKNLYSLSFTNSWFDETNNHFYHLTGNGSWVISDQLKLSLDLSYSDHHDNQQYITTLYQDYEPFYLFGRIKQKTLGMTFRLDYNISKDLTIQYYGNPFISSGDYSEYKTANYCTAEDVSERFFSLETTSYSKDEILIHDSHLSGQFQNPDFNYKSFQSNLVIRWEYQTGSTFFLVWSMSKENFEKKGKFSFKNDLDKLFNSYPGNVFMIKFTRWFII